MVSVTVRFTGRLSGEAYVTEKTSRKAAEQLVDLLEYFIVPNQVGSQKQKPPKKGK